MRAGPTLKQLRRVPPMNLRQRLQRRPNETVDRYDHAALLVMTGAGAEITMCWAATGAAQHLYPSVEAIISVMPIDQTTTRLSIVSSYLPPLCDVGIVIDHVVGHRISTAALRSFLARAKRNVLDPAPQPRRSRPARPPAAMDATPRHRRRTTPMTSG